MKSNPHSLTPYSVGGFRLSTFAKATVDPP